MTRQNERAAARRAHKAATRPGARKPLLIPKPQRKPRSHILKVVRALPNGRELVYHATKGFRRRLA